MICEVAVLRYSIFCLFSYSMSSFFSYHHYDNERNKPCLTRTLTHQIRGRVSNLTNYPPIPLAPFYIYRPIGEVARRMLTHIAISNNSFAAAVM